MNLVYKECQVNWDTKNIKTKAGQFYRTPKIGVLTVDYDDESAAQMQYLKSFLDRFTNHTMIENIGQMFMTYLYDASSLDGQCMPIFRLLDQDVTCLINQYPKEWLINEISHDELLKYDMADIRSFEPWWKLIIGNKALLPLLWEKFPDHPNLLPAFFDPPDESLSIQNP